MKICIQSIFLWVLNRGTDKAKKTLSCPLLFCRTSKSVPSIKSNFDVLTLQGELWVQLFGGVFNNFAFLLQAQRLAVAETRT